MEVDGCMDGDMNMMSPQRRSRPLIVPLLALCLLGALSACRMTFDIEGQGFVLASSTGAMYRQGTSIDFSAAYEDVFLAVPHPGHSFGGWVGLCNPRATDCAIVVPEALLEFDLDGSLEPQFLPDYDGPLRVVRTSICDSPIPDSGPFTISASSLDIDGIARADAKLQIYLVTPDLSFWLVGEETPEGFVFDLSERMLTYRDLALVVTAVDANGVLASVSSAY